MISSGHINVSINGVDVTNGLFISSLDIKVGRGEAIMQNIVITTRQQYNLPEDAVIYCCFNKLFKISPNLFNMWVNVSIMSVLLFTTDVIYIYLILNSDIKSCTQFYIVAVTIPEGW